MLSKPWSTAIVILGCFVHSHVARKFLFPSLSMRYTSHLTLTTHSAIINDFYIISVPGDPKVVVRSSKQQDKSYTKSCGHVGSVNLHDNSRFDITVC